MNSQTSFHQPGPDKLSEVSTRYTEPGSTDIDIMKSSSNTPVTVEEALQRTNYLLQAISRAQAQFISNANPVIIFDELVNTLLTLTRSQSGFLGEVIHPAGAAGPRLRPLAVAGPAQPAAPAGPLSPANFSGPAFERLLAISEDVLHSGSVITITRPAGEIWPHDHNQAPDQEPGDYRHFLGIPLYSDERLSGVVSLANFSGEYDHALLDYIQPFLQTCNNIIEAYRNDQRRQEAEKALRYRLDLEKLVSTISTRFINLPSPEIDPEISKSLQLIAEFSQVDHAHLFLFGDDQQSLTLSHEWCAPHSISRKLEGIATGVPIYGFKSSIEQLRRDKIISISSIAELAAEEVETRRYMQKHKVHSLLGVPLFYAGSMIGTIILEQTKVATPWNRDAISLLRIVGEVIANALTRKKAEDDTRLSLEKEKDLNELKSRFVSITSHEFRTPLSTILSSAELLEHYGHKWNEEKKLEHLHRIQGAVKEMNQLLTDILVIGKAEAGRLEFNPVKLDLAEFCAQLVEEIQISSHYNHKLVFRCQQPPLMVCADRKLIAMIVGNLLSNSFKYSPPGTTVTFDLSLRAGQVVLQVVDEGIGIPPEDHHRIFDLFHRAKNVGAISGSGLGLAIVKKAVELHGGQMELVSQPTRGTSLSISIPLGIGSETDEANPGN